MSDAKHAVVQAQNDRWGLVPIETCNSVPKVAVLHAKTTDEGWDPQRLVILVLKFRFCMHRMRGDVWYPLRLVILVQSRCFACKNYRWRLGPIEPINSCANHAVLHAQKDLWCLGPIETCCSGPKPLFSMHKQQIRAGTNRDQSFWC